MILVFLSLDQQQQQAAGYNVAYYPQQPGYQPQYQPQYTYGQPGQPPVAGQPPLSGQPMSGFTNYGFNPPSYDQVASPTKSAVPPSAPQ